MTASYSHQLDSMSSISTMDVTYEQFLNDEPEAQQQQQHRQSQSHSHPNIQSQSSLLPFPSPASISPTVSPRHLSSAALLVYSAADQMGDIDVEAITQSLGEERLTEVWQLEYLDALQWRLLGAPMGLVSFVRRMIEAKKQRQVFPASNYEGTVVSSHRQSLTSSHEEDINKGGSPRSPLEDPTSETVLPPITPRRSNLGGPANGPLAGSIHPPAQPRRQKSESSGIIYEEEFSSSSHSFVGEDDSDYETTQADGEHEESTFLWGSSLGASINKEQGPPILPKRMSSMSASKISSITMSSLSLNISSGLFDYNHVSVVPEEDEQR